MNKLSSILGTALFLAAIAIVVLQLDNNSRKEDIKILYKRNSELEKENIILADIVEKKLARIDTLEAFKEEIHNEVLVLKDGVAIKEQELRLIKGKYKTLANDSLLKLALKVYEKDSIASITNK